MQLAGMVARLMRTESHVLEVDEGSRWQGKIESLYLASQPISDARRTSSLGFAKLRPPNPRRQTFTSDETILLPTIYLHKIGCVLPEARHDYTLHPTHHIPNPRIPPPILLPRPPCRRPLQNADNALANRSDNRMSRLPDPAHIAQSFIRRISSGKGECSRLHKEGFE